MFAKNKVLATLLSMIMLLSIVPAGISYKASAASSGSITNQYIDAYITAEGRFTLGTKEGDPNKTSDNNKNLLYKWSSNYATSAFLLSVDGTNSFFTANSTSFSADGLSCVSTYTSGGIVVTQTISIEYNSRTQRHDVFRISYNLKNNNSTSASIGGRLMLDTMLGSNDSAPFRVPGYGNITTQKEFAGEDVPQYFTVMDNLSNPTVVANGTLFTSEIGEEKPDYVQFTSYSNISGNTTFHPSVTTSSSIGDSTVTTFWNPKSVSAGDSRNFSIYYGLGDFEPVVLDGDLTAAVSAPAELLLTANEQSYQSNPFIAEVRIHNSKRTTVNDVRVTISLPQGLSLASGTQTNTLSIASGEEKSSVFYIKAPVIPVEQTYSYSIKVESSALDETKVFSKTIKVPAAKCIRITYNANGGNGIVPTDNNYYRTGEVATILFENIPTREGYTFKGWSGSASATVPDFTENGSNTFTLGPAGMTLYAVWERDHVACIPSGWFVERVADCTQYGVEYKECKICGERLQERTIPATGHKYVYTKTVNPTCTAEGYELYTCCNNNCESTKKQIIEKLPHEYGNDNICDGCGHTIPVAHTHSYTAETVAPTCSAMGYTEYTCECGYSYRKDYIENLSHLWTETITKEKTCTTDGLKTYSCEKCSASFTEVIPACHNWKHTVTVTATCTTDGEVSRSCADCDAKEVQPIPAGHSWDEGIETKAPTCTEEGVSHHICTVCGCEEDVGINPLGHSYVNGICIRCGSSFIDNITENTKHPQYGMYFSVDDVKSGYGPDIINEYGVFLDYNPDANLKKVGVYLTQDGTMWRRCIACVGDNITYATYVPYLSYNEDIKYTGLNSAWINIFRLKEGDNNIWYYSNYATIGVNLEDAYGNLLLSLYDIGEAGAKTRIFDDLDEMIAWLSEDDSDCIRHNESDWIIDSMPTGEKEGVKHIECTVCGKTLKEEIIPRTSTVTLETKNDSVVLGETFEVYVSAQNLDSVKLFKIVTDYSSDVFELVSVEWLQLKGATIQISVPEIKSTWNNSTSISGNVAKLVFKANALTSGSEITTYAYAQGDELFEIPVMGLNISVVENNFGGLELVDDSTYMLSNGVVSEIGVGTDIDSFKDNFRLDVVITNADGVEIGINGKICTGYIVTSVETGEQAAIVVSGDVDGDGKQTTTDYLKIKTHLLNSNTLDGVYYAAADMDGSSTVDTADYVKLKSKLLKSAGVN